MHFKWKVLGFRARRLVLPKAFAGQGSAHLPVIAPTGSSEPVLKPQSKARPIFSISVYSGSDLTKLGNRPGVRNPVLTRDDVSDCQADFVADPFIIRVDGKWHMFFEVLVRAGWRGHIGWATSKDGLSWNYRRLVLSEPFHLSYPNILEWKGDYYIIPESYQAAESGSTARLAFRSAGNWPTLCSAAITWSILLSFSMTTAGGCSWRPALPPVTTSFGCSMRPICWGPGPSTCAVQSSLPIPISLVPPGASR